MACAFWAMRGVDPEVFLGFDEIKIKFYLATMMAEMEREARSRVI